MFLTTLLLVSLLALSNAGVLTKFDPRIVNGEDAKLGEIPYQVSLQMKKNSFHFCGGSVLNKNYVISAAHCVQGKIAENIKAVVGMIDLRTPGPEYDIEIIIIHQNYTPSDSYKNDVALLKVAKPLVMSKLISPVVLPSPNAIVNTDTVATVSGWGSLWRFGPSPKQLQRVDVRIADSGYCQEMYSRFHYTIYPSHICAYDPNVERGACNGDSGGPLTVNGTTLIGIVSFSSGNKTEYPNVHTRVSSHVNWILKHSV